MRNSYRKSLGTWDALFPRSPYSKPPARSSNPTWRFFRIANHPGNEDSDGLLSNTNHAHWEWIVRQCYPVVEGWFEPIILSYQAKAMKPARAIYDHATRLAEVPPERIFFTDDRADNCEGGRAAGWQVVRFENAADLMKTVLEWEQS